MATLRGKTVFFTTERVKPATGKSIRKKCEESLQPTLKIGNFSVRWVVVMENSHTAKRDSNNKEKLSVKTMEKYYKVRHDYRLNIGAFAFSIFAG